MTKFNIIIPARMNSARLPGKMLADIADLPLVVRVALRAKLSNAVQVIVATDSQEIKQVCQQHQIDAVMTSENCASGTDRIAEAVKLLNLADDEIVINVQGDEPLIDPELINQLANFIAQHKTSIATVAHPVLEREEIFNPNIVKVVLDYNNHALYFSRSPIPYFYRGYSNPDNFSLPANLPILRHIGIYAYQVKFLQIYQDLKPCPLEQAESLEQLRALYHGYKIAVMLSNDDTPIGVDTAEDLHKVREIFAK